MAGYSHDICAIVLPVSMSCQAGHCCRLLCWLFCLLDVYTFWNWNPLLSSFVHWLSCLIPIYQVPIGHWWLPNKIFCPISSPNPKLMSSGPGDIYACLIYCSNSQCPKWCDCLCAIYLLVHFPQHSLIKICLSIYQGMIVSDSPLFLTLPM